MSFNHVFQQQVETWNGATSYNTSGSSLVDLFFKTVQGLTPEALMPLLESAIKEDPLSAIKIVFHARDPRGGKKWKDIFKFTFGTHWEFNKELQEKIMTNPLFWLLGAEYGSWKSVIELGMSIDPQSTRGEVFISTLCNQLQEDYESKDSISLLAKWAPSPGKSLARKYKNTYKAILDNLGVNEKGYRLMLTELRERLNIVETHMCSKQWDSINYNQVPSVAMKVYRNAFQKRDEERFTTWVASLEEGKSKINAKLLYPHQVTKALIGNTDDTQEKLIEAQWKVLVEQFSSTLKGIIPMCDVSGSMDGTPMDVSLALGLLVSEITEEPFKDLIITFTDEPEFHTIKGTTLRERIKSFEDMTTGLSTNFQGAFEVLLRRANKYKVKPEDMPRTILVFSDCQFNEFDEGNLKTNLEGIQEQYKSSGYQIPQLVFWNLNGSTPDFPSCDTPGVTLMSGFSESLLKALMTDKPLNHLSILKSEVLDNSRYNALSELI